VHAAHDIAGIEVLWVDPRQPRHVLVLGAQRRHHPSRAFFVHVRDEPADEVGDEVGAQRPARPEIAEDPGHIGDTGEHGAAIGHGVAEDELPVVDRKRDVAEHAQMKPGRGDDDIGGEGVAGPEKDAGRVEALDLIGDDRRLAGMDRLQQIAVGDKGDALLPGPVAWREMGRDVVVGPEMGADCGEQLVSPSRAR
jgi:hypothetical protein